MFQLFHLMLKLSNCLSLVLILMLSTLNTFDLRIKNRMISFNLLVSSLKSLNSSPCIISYFFELLRNCLILKPLPFQWCLILDNLSGQLLIFELISLSLFSEAHECLINFYLNKLFKSLIVSDFKINVGLFWDKQLVTAKFLFVELKFFLKSRKLFNHLLLRVSKLLDNLSIFAFLLLHGKLEILSLRL